MEEQQVLHFWASFQTTYHKKNVGGGGGKLTALDRARFGHTSVVRYNQPNVSQKRGGQDPWVPSKSGSDIYQKEKVWSEVVSWYLNLLVFYIMILLWMMVSTFSSFATKIAELSLRHVPSTYHKRASTAIQLTIKPTRKGITQQTMDICCIT